MRIRIRIQFQIQVYSWNFFFFFFLNLKLQFTYPQASLKNAQATGEAFNLKTWKFLTFFYFCGSFLLYWIRIRILNAGPDPAAQINADPDPASQINADPDADADPQPWAKQWTLRNWNPGISATRRAWRGTGASFTPIRSHSAVPSALPRLPSTTTWRGTSDAPTTAACRRRRLRPPVTSSWLKRERSSTCASRR